MTLPNGEVTAIMRSGQGSQLMMIYAAGYAAIFLLFLMLYWRAYSKREALELSQPEIFETTNTIEEMAVQILIGSISLGFAAAGQAGWAGLTYVLIGPLLTMHGFWSRRRRRILIGA